MGGRNSQVSRLLTILSLLEGAPQGLTVSEIEPRIKDLGVGASRRTIYRDLEGLAQSGFPLIEKDKSDDEFSARWSLERQVKITQYLALDHCELFALYLARGVLVPLKDTIFYRDLDRAFKRIEEKLGARNGEYFRGLASELCFEPSPRWGLGLDVDVIETVRAACAEGHVLQVTYSSASSGNERRRKLGPHYLYFVKGAMYLVAEDLEDGAVKVFSVTRMRDAEMLDQGYDGQIQNPEDLFKNALGIFRGDHPKSVKLDFQSSAAHYVKERRWHSSQRILTREGGRLQLSVEVAVTPELVQWILGFGAAVFVKEPTELRESVRAAAQATADVYRSSSK